MADAEPNESKDRHPELSAPIIDLSLEAQIARAEQAVIDRDARVRGDARRITDTLRSQRGAAVRWAAIAAIGATACAAGYAGYRTWRGRRASRRGVPGQGEPPKAATFSSEIASFVRLAVQWALKLHHEQGVAGSLFGMIRGALWPSWREAKPGSAGVESDVGPRGASDAGS